MHSQHFIECYTELCFFTYSSEVFEHEFTLSEWFRTLNYKQLLQFICSNFDRSKTEDAYTFRSLFASHFKETYPNTNQKASINREIMEKKKAKTSSS